MGKQTKVKNAKKVMAFFGINFDLHPPYNVLGVYFYQICFFIDSLFLTSPKILS